MSNADDVLSKFKIQVGFLINQITDFTHSEQFEILEYIRKCIKKVSKKIRSPQSKNSLKSKKKIKKKPTTKKNILTKIKIKTSLESDEKPKCSNKSEKSQAGELISEDQQLTDEKPAIDKSEHYKSTKETSLNDKTNINNNNFVSNLNQSNSSYQSTKESDDENEKYKHIQDEDNAPPDISQFDDSEDISTERVSRSAKNCAITSKTLNKKFSCFLCRRSFTKYFLLKKHIFNHAGSSQSCLKCRTTFNNAIAFKFHILNSKCDNNYSVDAELSSVNASDNVSILSMTVCPHCSESFSRICNLRRHMWGRCNYLFAKQKEHHCEKCDMSFTSRLLLKQHNSLHRKTAVQYNYECKICHAKFPRRAPYRAHSKLCRETLEKKMTKEEPVESELNDHWCRICEKAFKYRHTYMRHWKRKHLKQQDTTALKPFMCDKCGIGFTSQDGLTTHITRLHTEKAFLFCSHCPFRSTSASNMSRHSATHEGGWRRYACHHCPALLTSHSVLKSHIISLHTNERKFICDICTKSFKLQNHLNRHKLIHDPAFTHPCAHCPMGFKRKCHLDRHTHSKHKEHIPKDLLATAVMKFNKTAKKKPPKPVPPQEPIPTEIAEDRVYSLMDVQSGELVTLSVTEMSKNAVLNMPHTDLPDLGLGLYSLEPLLDSKDPLQEFFPHYVDMPPHHAPLDPIKSEILSSDLVSPQGYSSCAIPHLTHLS